MTNRAYPLEIRGFAHSSVDALRPLPERPEESLPLSYIETVQSAISNFTPDTSGQSSPTTDNTPSIVNGLSESNTWSTHTGILTGRSTCSVNSWGNEDEFDRQASATVKRMFDEIDGMLFEGIPFNGSTQLLSECEEWFTQFPHLRICGHQLLNTKDDGTKLIPVAAEDSGMYNQRPQTSVLEDVEEFGAFDSQGLFIEGFHLDPLPEPLGSYMSDDELNGYYAEFEEEVLAEDGEVEEYFGYDLPAVEEEGSESNAGNRYRRQLRRGYPPLTPNACAKDAVVSQLFDQAWGEVVLWLRDLLSLYSQKVLRDKPQFLADVVGSSDRVESPPRPFSQSIMSRNPFPSQTRLRTLSSFNAPLDPSTLINAIKIQSLPLNHRAPSATTSHVLDSREGTPFNQGRPGSSSTVASRSTARIGGHSSDPFMHRIPQFKRRNLPSILRLTHMESSKPKTPNVQDDVMGNFVQGKKLLFPEKERLSSPPHPSSSSPAPYNVMGKIILPPLDRFTAREATAPQNGGRNSAKHVSYDRASSAATDRSRQSLKERNRNFAGSPTRPNTTSTASHSLKGDPPHRRLSTPMETHSNQGGVYSRGHTRHSNIPLTGITGVSMQIGNHPANETNTSSHSHHFDGRGISPVSDEEYDGFKSPGPSNQPSQRRNKLVSTIR